jgi:hypothetical protein
MRSVIRDDGAVRISSELGYVRSAQSRPEPEHPGNPHANRGERPKDEGESYNAPEVFDRSSSPRADTVFASSAFTGVTVDPRDFRRVAAL